MEDLSSTLVRLDIVRNVQGIFKIVEIEVDKYHGLGYTTAGRHMSEGEVGVGLVSRYADMTTHTPAAIMLGKQERFYGPELRYFQREVCKRGGQANVVAEEQMYGHSLSGRVFALPTIHDPEIKKNTEQAVQRGDLQVLSSLPRFLTSKHMLSLICNSHGEPLIEDLLHRCVGQPTLSFIRGVIPHTMSLVGTSRERRAEIAQEVRAGENYYVKYADMSGARGVHSPHDKEAQVATITGKVYDRVVLQGAVQTTMTQMSALDLEGRERDEQMYSTRYGLFVSGMGDVLDLGLTSSVGPVAHGGVDSILGSYTVSKT